MAHGKGQAGPVSRVKPSGTAGAAGGSCPVRGALCIKEGRFRALTSLNVVSWAWVIQGLICPNENPPWP